MVDAAARLEVVPTVLLLVVSVLGTAPLVISKSAVGPTHVVAPRVDVHVTVEVINVVIVMVLVLVVVVVESSLFSLRISPCAMPSLASPRAATTASRNIRIVPSVVNNIFFV